METIVLFYFYEGMADFKIAFLIALFSTVKNGRKVVSVSEDTKTLKSAYGITFVPEIKINSIKSLDNIDALVIPGGMSAGISDDLAGLISKLDEQKKLLAAICFGPLFLARAGVLKNRKYTTTALPEVLAEQIMEDPFYRENYISESVVRDSNFITATGAPFIDFAVEVADYLGLIADENEKMELERVYKNI